MRSTQLKIPLRLRRWPDGIKEKAYKMLAGKNVSFPVADRAYRRWRADHPAEPCIYGADQAIAVDCSCPGCIEKLLFMLYDWVTLQFSPQPGDPAAPGVPPA